MIKTSILDFKVYHTSIKNSVKSKWSSLLILFPVGLYLAYRIFEPQILSFVISIFPMDEGKSVAFYKDLLRLVFNELLWLTALLLLAWIFVVYVPLLVLVQALEERLLLRRKLFSTAFICFSFIASVFISYNTLQVFPNSSDEYVYLYQAQTLSNNRLWELAHDYPRFFSFNNMPQKEGISVGRFPPGWPLALSIAYIVGFPAFLVNPVLGLLALIFFYRFVKKFYGDRVAIWSLLALAFTPFFLFNAASFFSHTLCLLLTLGFVYCLYTYEETGKTTFALLSGLLIGWVAITRYYTAFLIVIPFLIYIAFRERFHSSKFFFWTGVGSLPCIGFLLWYNYSITGNMFVPVTTWAYSEEALGFVRGHTPVKGIEHVVRRLLMFLYWCSPAWLLLYGVYLIRKLLTASQRLLHPEDYIFAFLIIGYFFYYEIGGNQYGPRFYFEALPFMLVFVVTKVFHLKQKWALALFIAGTIYTIVKIPFIAQREYQVIAERRDVYDVVRKKNITNAVIFIASTTGVIRPMPIGDLTRNDVAFANDVIFVHDLKHKNILLADYYPNRTFYRYVRDREKAEGKLIKITFPGN